MSPLHHPHQAWAGHFPDPPTSDSICSSLIKRTSNSLLDHKQDFPKHTKLPCPVAGVLTVTERQHENKGRAFRIYEDHEEQDGLNGDARQMHTLGQQNTCVLNPPVNLEPQVSWPGSLKEPMPQYFNRSSNSRGDRVEPGMNKAHLRARHK